MSDTYHYEDGAIHHDHKRVVNIDHVNGADLGRLLHDFWKDDAEEAEIIEEMAEAGRQTEATQSGPVGVLASDKAMKYWLRLQQAGFVDADCRLTDATTRKQAMYIAESFAERMGIKSKWKTFEKLWGISNLAQEKWDMQESGNTPSRSKEIDRMFDD